MHVCNILGIAGAASGLLSAGLWVHASMLAWKLGRQGAAGDYSTGSADTSMPPNAFEAHFTEVGNRNAVAAAFSGLSRR